MIKDPITGDGYEDGTPGAAKAEKRWAELRGEVDGSDRARLNWLRTDAGRRWIAARIREETIDEVEAQKEGEEQVTHVDLEQMSDGDRVTLHTRAQATVSRLKADVLDLEAQMCWRFDPPVIVAHYRKCELALLNARNLLLKPACVLLACGVLMLAGCGQRHDGEQSAAGVGSATTEGGCKDGHCRVNP